MIGPYKFALLAMIALLPLTALQGCKSLSGGTPPNSFERVIFVTETNVVSQPVVVERTVWETNTVEQVQTITNVADQVVYQTNFLQEFVPITVTFTETNRITNYTLVPKAETEADLAAVGGAINLLFPGLGIPLAGILVGFYRMWGKLRSAKTANTVLVTNFASVLEWIETLPGGTAEVDKLKAWLRKNQDKFGAQATIAEVMSKYMQHAQVKQGTEELKNLMNALSKQ
jgi:hypothetical protein